LRKQYEVRIRENGVKKSRFYSAQSPRQAASCYKGNGHIMSVEKVGKARLLGIGDFFKLGDSLLGEIKEQNKKRRFNERAENKEAPTDY